MPTERSTRLAHSYLQRDSAGDSVTVDCRNYYTRDEAPRQTDRQTDSEMLSSWSC